MNNLIDTTTVPENLDQELTSETEDLTDEILSELGLNWEEEK